MTFFTFLILIIFIGITGWSTWYLFGSSNHGKKEEKSHGIGSVFEQHILIFLTGFGISSILLFLIALAGWFEIKVIVILFSILPAVCFARHYFYKRNVWSLQFSQYLLSCMILGFACFGLGKLAKPFEAVIQADDASVYIGAAFQLAKSGSLSYRDPLVIEMTQEERNQIFDNRFATDTTGDRIRFPGGVRLINSSTGTVVFTFYHLFPVWLGLGIQTLGEHSFLNLLSLFLALKLISLFLLAREAGWLLLGISVPLVCFIFYPQLYFSLMPTSELLTEALFLSGLWVFVSGIKSQSVLHAWQQSIVGVLWGALFQCRLETLFMLSMSLILLFTIVPIFAMNWSKWRILMMELLFFLCLAFYYQIRRGEYLYVLTSSQFLGNQAIVLIGIEILNSMVNFVQNNPLPGFLAFLTITTIVLVTLRWWILCDNGFQQRWFKAAVGILLIGISLAAMIGPWASWARFVKHVTWVSLYFSPLILLTLFVGTLFFLYWIIREQTRAALWTLFIMFSLPAVSYLIRPLVIIEQPWGVRKFVPMVFPLFFLISLTGWFYFLKKILVRPKYLHTALFSILIFLLAGSFFERSRYLLQDALFADLVSQIRSLASTIPKDGLIGWLVEVASITKYWGIFLHLCANAIQAETILELGSCVGISSCYLASAKSCKNFITIEGSNTLIPAIESNLRKITNHFKIVNALFDAGLDQILPSLKIGIDLVFIDGDHTKAATLRYFNRITPFLNCGSVILFDDIHWSREMWETWQVISESRGLVFTVNLGRIGFCIWNGQEEKPRNYNLSKFTIDWGKGKTSAE